MKVNPNAITPIATMDNPDSSEYSSSDIPLSDDEYLKNNNQRFTHWALSIQPYCFEMRHRSGPSNSNVDGLSRGPLQIEGQSAMAVTTCSLSH